MKGRLHVRGEEGCAQSCLKFKYKFNILQGKKVTNDKIFRNWLFIHIYIYLYLYI